MGLFSSRTPTAAPVPPPPAPTQTEDGATGEFWKPETPIPVAAVADPGTPVVMDVRSTPAAEAAVTTMVEEPTGPIEPLAESDDAFSLEAFEKLAEADEVVVAAPAAPATPAVPSAEPATAEKAPVAAPEPVMAPEMPVIAAMPVPASETAAPVAQMVAEESPIQRIEKLQAQATEKIGMQQAEVNRLKDEIAALQEKRRDAEAALTELQKLPEQLSKAKTELEIIEKNRQQLATEEQSLASGLEAIEGQVR